MARASGDPSAILGESPAIRRVVDLARRVAATDASVFITGESGTGKELIAEFIHRQSRRAARAFVAINCAAMPETLLETEMFGHRRGAFTGANQEKQGLLEAAHFGTLFLDELAQMPLAIQAKLLRVIQDGVVRRVGSDAVDATVDVRFIAATNCSAEAAVAAGLLREDLYYRLRVFPLELPPLRERRDDIPVLAEHFLRCFWRRHRGESARIPVFTAAALRAMTEHPWRGNVRELQNVIEHGVILFEPGTTIEPGDLPFATVSHAAAAAASVADDAMPAGVEPESLHAMRERIIASGERRYLAWVLRRASGNLSQAARLAGIQRTTLYRLMAKRGVHREVVTSTPG